MRMLLPLALLLGCNAGPPGGPPTAADAGAAPVEVVTVGRGTVQDGVEGTATVEARERAVVRAQVAGTIGPELAEEGDAVAADGQLAAIERPVFAEVQAQARASRDKAAREVAALEKLAREGLVPGQQLIDARFQLKQASLEVDRLEKERGQQTVQSPIAGVVTARHVQPGEAVSIGAPLFDVADVDALEVHLRLPERHLPRLAVDLPAELSAEGSAARWVPGRVERIAPTVDARSGTVKVTVRLDPAAARAAGLRPGMYVRARIIVDVHADTLVLPKRALIFEEDRAFAYQVQDGKAHKRRLALGYADRDAVEVLTPLAEGDTVVVFGQRGLEEGAAVKVVAPPAPASAASAAPPTEETPK
ncbi:MAG: efflux RND transporter periplasmic adaptor subunit [Myxococcales bacterium]|nr:efflux RND transporter periplasmic adaptor subunit [Myxococcales bacterium]